MGVAIARCDLTASQLLGAVRGVQAHAGHERDGGREWRPTDTATMAEYARRSWNWARVEGLKLIGVPRALENLLHAVSVTGRRMNRCVWRPLVGVCCAAYRATGVVGVRLSYEQLAVLLGTSRSTVGRVVRDLVAARLIRRDHTYQCDDGGTERAYETSVYSLGGRALAYLRGGLDAGDDAARWAAAARARARKERRARYVALWNAQRETRGPTFAEQWLAVGASEPDSSRGRVKEGPTPSTRGGHVQPAPPVCGENNSGGRSQAATRPPLQAAQASETPETAAGPVSGTDAPEERAPLWHRLGAALVTWGRD